jgi:hypothetical protein
MMGYKSSNAFDSLMIGAPHKTNTQIIQIWNLFPVI